MPWPQEWGAPESLVPIIAGFFAAANQQVETEAWLQRAWDATYWSLCNPDDMQDTAACESLRASGQFRPRVYVVNQRPQRSTPAPLGWVLSAASQAEMTEDLDLQQTTPRSAWLPIPDPNHPETRPYGTLHDLLTSMGLDPSLDD